MSGAETTEVARASREQQLLQQDTEVRKIILDAVAAGVEGVRIDSSIIDGNVLRTIEGASQVTITVHDQARSILKSGVLQDDDGDLRAIDILLDGLWFRLARADKEGNDLILTFEDRIVAYMRGKKGPRKANSRSKVTRAEYILQLIRSIKRERIPVRINELHKAQPIAKLTEQERTDRSKQSKQAARDQSRAAGFPGDGKAPGVNKRQAARIATCLQQAEKDNAGDRAVLAMLVAGFGESDWGDNRGSRGTTFQTLTIPESKLALQAHHFLTGGNSFAAGGAIGAVRDHPDWTVGTVASHVEVSDAAGSHYDVYFSKARKILDAWGGFGAGGAVTTTYRKQFAFKVEKKETYWDAIQRFAEEVHWRAFVTSGVFYYISEDDLFKSRARYILAESKDGVQEINFSHDYRKKVSKANATVRIDRWAVPPGICVLIEELGPANGKWLVESVTRSLFSSEAQLTLKKPMHEKKEPRTELKRHKASSSSDGPGGAKLGTGLRYPLAEHGKDIGGVAAHAQRAWGNWQSDNAVDIAVPRGTSVYAVEAGTIIRLGGRWNGGSGNPDGWNITIDNGAGRQWFYTHLMKRTDLRVGQKVAEGDYFGKSGAANGVDHLHISVNHGDPEVLLGLKGGHARPIGTHHN